VVDQLALMGLDVIGHGLKPYLQVLETALDAVVSLMSLRHTCPFVAGGRDLSIGCDGGPLP
jgi:hypothetical protein